MAGSLADSTLLLQAPLQRARCSNGAQISSRKNQLKWGSHQLLRRRTFRSFRLNPHRNSCSIQAVVVPVSAPAVLNEEERRQMCENYGFTQIGEPLPDDITLRDIISTLPKKVFEIDDAKAWRSVLISVTSYALGIFMLSKAPWYLLPLAWAWTGTAATGFFVIGHDCAHKSFSRNKLVEDIVGTLAFLPLIYPYEPWRFKHDQHHAKTNMLQEDTAWHPVRREEFDSKPLLRKGIIFGYGPFRPWMSIAHWLLWHFNLKKFRPNEAQRVKISLACVFAFICIGWPLIIYKTGIIGWINYWFMPFMVYHFWMSTFTMVHHTAPHIPFKASDAWDAAQAQLSGTVHCNYPRWVEILCHDINVHIPHHISPRIPSYNLRDAHRSLQENWGKYLNEANWNWRLMKTIMTLCHVYSEEHNYIPFDRLRPEESGPILFLKKGAGLANLGNTCFLSSVLQCLTYTEPLAAYLQSGKHKLSCRTAGFCAMCALQSHVVEALQATGKILRPFHLVKNLRCISRNFRSARQEDAHEYMINLLEAMHKSCLPAGVASESSSAYEKSLVHKIFGGLFRSQVKCTQCTYCSNKFDPFLDLSLEIVKADSLCKALSHFISEEQLDGGEKQYHCSQCNQKVRALKNMSIHKAPYVLTIHLKRFGSHASGQKIGKQVDFDPKLNLKPYVSDPLEEDLEYTLYGVLVHAGYGTHSGHYYCFVRTSGGMWFSLNDDQVCQVSEKMVLQQKAYMLFYVRNVGSIIKRENNPSHKGIKRLPTSEKVKGISVTEHFLKNDTVASEQESNGQHTTDARKVNVKDGGNSRSKNCKIMSKGKGRKVSHLRNFSFRPWRFLILSLSMRRKKRVGISQTLTGGGVRKIGIPKVNDDPEREGLVREPVDPIRPLKTDLREHSVPCWEDVEIQPESQVIDDEPRSIGYLLDEEEMEYDRGRRKKVKTQRDSFGGPNPFEELALARVQKKMRGRC